MAAINMGLVFLMFVIKSSLCMFRGGEWGSVWLKYNDKVIVINSQKP